MGVILSSGRWWAGRSRGIARTATGLLLGLVAVAATGCAPARPSSADGVLRVTASFYPLQFVAARVGGVHVRVSNLTAAGAEPHDVELSARDLVAMRQADLVVYLHGLAPAVDDGVRVAAAAHALDVTQAAGLQHSEGAHGEDMHFWMDPTRLGDVAQAVAGRLAEVDPANADRYRENADSLIDELATLDRELESGLAACASRDLVTSHSAFGFLAARYGLHEWGIVGLAPDAEPTASALAKIADLVREQGVRTVYTETLVSGAVARTVADATGASVAVLDPLEGLAEGVTGDYLTIMRTNLATLRRGQGCT